MGEGRSFWFMRLNTRSRYPLRAEKTQEPLPCAKVPSNIARAFMKLMPTLYLVWSSSGFLEVMLNTPLSLFPYSAGNPPVMSSTPPMVSTSMMLMAPSLKSLR